MRRRLIFPITLLAAFAVIVSSVSRLPGRTIAAGAITGAAGLARLESSPPVYDVVYRYGQNISAADGAYGPNISAPRSAWFLEYQRAGAVDAIDGVLRPDLDPTLVSDGLRMFHFGLARQAPDGAFPGSAWPFHGTALFLSEAAPALVILRESSLAGRFDAELRWEIARMRRAAYAMVRSVGGPNGIDDSSKNHRFFEAALALGATAVLSGDRTLLGWSRRYAWRGIRMERASGVMPEDGGHDSGYQAVGMNDAARYLALAATGALRNALKLALARGEAWELSRIEPDGSVDQRGDTRTRGCEERDPAGHCKTVFYAPIFSALARWSTIDENPEYATFSHLVWLRSGYGRHN